MSDSQSGNMTMNSNLEGKTAIVTGGGRDIGRACALRLAAAGAAVAINYHNSGEGADSAANQIVAAGGNSFSQQGDMTSDDDVAKLITKTLSELSNKSISLSMLREGLLPEGRWKRWKLTIGTGLWI